MRQLKIHNRITPREPTVDKYLNEIGKELLISVQEEVELAQKIKQGDQQALEKLVKANLRFVVSVAKQYQNQGLSLPDLINAGNYWLIKAAQRFDESKGFKFISYAVRWIRQNILQEICDTGNIVRLPLNIKWDQYKINKFISTFEQQHYREPSLKEMIDAFDTTETKIKKTLRSYIVTHSLQDSINAEDTRPTENNLADTETPTPDHWLLLESLSQEIQHLFARMDKGQKWFAKEKYVLTLFFGLADNKAHSIEEIAQLMWLTRERVRQIKEGGIRRLKKIAKKKGLKQYL